MQQTINRILQLLFPDGYACIFCRREARLNELGACPACAAALRRVSFPPPPYGTGGLVGGYCYDAVSAPAVYRLKYRNARYLAPKLAAAVTVPQGRQWDAAVPVPLHAKRLRQRRYNQSALLAQCLAERLSMPVLAALERTRDTRSQTTLAGEQRIKNVREAFRVTADVTGLRLLLVDDVITTGATACECARSLKEAGARDVCVCGIMIHPQLL